MSLASSTSVKCPACGKLAEVDLARSVNATRDPSLKEQLLKGTLNRFVCACGYAVRLESRLLYTDSERDFFCQVAPGGDADVADAIAAFIKLVPGGTKRVVRSRNALLEKVKLLDAGLADWLIELVKVLLLTTLGRDVNQVVLFEAVDRTAGQLSWVLFEDSRSAPKFFTSPLTPYERGFEKWQQAAPAPNVFEVDRHWAVQTMRTLMASRT